MAERSKQIKTHDPEKISNINVETQKLLKKYQVDMSLRDLSEKTIRGYMYDLYQWLIYVYDNQFNQCVTELDEDDLTEFLYFCKTEGNNVERMKRRMASISAFYKFLRKKRIIKENPMEFVDRPKKGQPVVVQTFLTTEQVELMRQKLIEYGNLQLRTYALFSLSTMARVNAIANLKWEQINFEQRICSGVVEKEGYIVELFFSEEVSELLKQLKKEREESGYNDYGYVFRSNQNKENEPINNSTLANWCTKIGNMIGVLTLHPYDLRHSGSTLLKNAGMPLEDISTLLNHQSTETTKRFYIKENSSKISAMKDKYKI